MIQTINFMAEILKAKIWTLTFQKAVKNPEGHKLQSALISNCINDAQCFILSFVRIQL